jgi:hypothetical protein
MILGVLFAAMAVAVAAAYTRLIRRHNRLQSRTQARPLTPADVEVFALELEWGGDYLVAALKREKR